MTEIYSVYPSGGPHHIPVLCPECRSPYIEMQANPEGAMCGKCLWRGPLDRLLVLRSIKDGVPIYLVPATNSGGPWP